MNLVEAYTRLAPVGRIGELRAADLSPTTDTHTHRLLYIRERRLEPILKGLM